MTSLRGAASSTRSKSSTGLEEPPVPLDLDPQHPFNGRSGSIKMANKGRVTCQKKAKSHSKD